MAVSPERRAFPLLPLVTLLAGLMVVGVLSRPPQKRKATEHLPPLLPRIEFLKVVGAGYRELLADYFWIRTSHALGVARTQHEYLDVYYLVDLTTDLDPKFRLPYIVGGTAVPFNYGRERWTNTKEATAILEKGFRQFPEDVFLRMMLAYNLSYFEGNYERAARLIEETSRLPGAPSYLAGLATRLYAQAGELDEGLALAQSLAATADDPESRRAFEKRTQELLLEKELRQVDEAVEKFKARTGRLPWGVPELLVSGDLARLPNDPFGGEVVIDNAGRAQSTATADRFKVHDPRERYQ